jgi:hypothetical protein
MYNGCMLNKIKELNNMDKHEIYRKYRSQFIGYIVLQQHYNNEKPLSKTDIDNLVNLSHQLYRSKDYSLRIGWGTDTTYGINRRVAVKHMGAYMGNYWSRYCNLNKKIGLLNINTDDYGVENVYVSLLDTRLEKITKEMYQELENLYKDATTKKECA